MNEKRSPEERESWTPEPGDEEAARKLQQITDVLVSIASGKFDVRAARSHQGDAWDVLAFLANETAEEVKRLVEQLRQERRELEEAQEKLHQAEKLAALGELAGGVAHELNQPLTVMQTLAELLLQAPQRTVEERRREVELIAAATKRMGRIVSSIRTFGRQAPLSLRNVRLVVPLREALALLEGPLRAANIVVEVAEEETVSVLGDAEALQQVFINLLTNARDVFEEEPAGRPRTIRVRLEVGAERVCVSVEDNGPGVPTHAAEKLFDPFFSTKSVGRGTGLGLSISHGIVVEHGGTLIYRPGEAGGACFVMELPLSEGP